MLYFAAEALKVIFTFYCICPAVIYYYSSEMLLFTSYFHVLLNACCTQDDNKASLVDFKCLHINFTRETLLTQQVPVLFHILKH